MTKQKAIEVIKAECYIGNLLDLDRTATVNMALDMAIKALEQQPSEDCISRQTAIDALSHMMDTDGFRDGWAVSRANVDCMLRSLPPVTPQQKIGKWIGIESLDGSIHYMCDNCKEFGIDYYDYCPNCGAKMESEEDK